jgi:hypothetical protein
MRSRPKVRVFLTPRRPIPGDSVRADIELTSTSETPVDDIEVRLTGDERRYRGSTMAGNVSIPHYATHRHADLVAHLGKSTLTEGVHRRSITFAIPPTAPPAYQSGTAAVEWTLKLRVDIPWWPDRRAGFQVGVVTAPLHDVVDAPRTFSSSNGPQGRDLYLEASLDRSTFALGDVVSGAVSLSNVAYHRVSKVIVACVAMERAVVASSVGTREVARLETLVREGKIEEGASMPFRFRFPEEATCTFRGECVAVDWTFEVRAVLSLARDVTMAVPIVVGRPASDRRDEAPHRVSPVGRDRRALIFAEAARRAGWDHEPGEERLTRAIDGATIEFGVEHRGGEGRWLVGTVRWPDLGLGLRVVEKRWIDRLRGNAVELERAFGERFRITVREPAQAESLLDAPARAAVLAFRQVTIEDTGAWLSDPGAAHTLDELQKFADRVLVAARALTNAARNIPPPEKMAAHLDAWRAFADGSNGRLVVGEMSVRDATIDRERVDVITRWESDRPIGARVCVHTRAKTVADDARPAIDALRTELGTFDVVFGPIDETRVLQWDLSAPVDDPRALEPTIFRLTEVARLARAERGVGPYR